MKTNKCIVEPGKEGKTTKRANDAKQGQNKKTEPAKQTKKSKPDLAKAPKQPEKAAEAKPEKKADGSKPAKPHNRTRKNKAAAAPATFTAVLADKDMMSGSFLSMEEAIRIANFDRTFAKVSTDADYAEKNKWQYYVCINLWLHVVYDLHPMDNVVVMRRLRDYIRLHGLIATIRAGKHDAAALLKEEDSTHLTFILGGLNLKQKLTALRFPKRFTPIATDVLYSDAVAKWLRVERISKSHNHRNYILNTRYDFIASRVKDVLAQWCKNYVPIEQFILSHIGPVPTGATFEKDEHGRSLSYRERVAQIAEIHKQRGGRSVFGSWTPCPKYSALIDLPIQKVDKRWPLKRTPQRYIHRYNRLVCVPKTADTPRIVCPESPVNQYMQRMIRDDLEGCVPKWVRDHLPCRDQTVMERAAQRGVHERTTTTDLSHASDSVVLRHILDMFPAHVARDLKEWRPTHTIMPDGTVHELQQLATMGAGFTWYVMALYLLAIMVVVCDLEGVPARRKNLCFAFGDDLIHPSEITDTLYWVLEMLSFEINKDKSFGDGSPYRESCGSEWWTEGSVTTDIRTLYYPRFPICCRANKPIVDLCSWQYDPTTGGSVFTDTLSRFVALQHALYYEYPTAADFLTSVIVAIEPRMTTSLAGSVCSDLWGPFEQPIIKDCKTLGTNPPTWFDPTLLRDVPATVRTGHLTPVVQGGRLPDDALLNEWLYRSFLKSGPSCSSDPLMALLGQTEAPSYTDPLNMTIKWVVKF